MTDAQIQHRVGVGHSDADDPVVAASESVRAALGGRTPSAGDLVMVFPTNDFDPQQFFEAARQAGGEADVIGCTSFASFTSTAQVPKGAAAAYVPSGGVRFGVACVDSVGPDVFNAAKRVSELARDRAGEEGEHSVLLMLSDGLAGDQREVVRGSYAVTGATVPLVGGAAGESLKLVNTHQYAEGKVMCNGLVAVWINSDDPIGVGVAHGWHPIGEPMMVTRAEGNIIHELDGRPAVEAYLAQRGSDPLREDLRGDEATTFVATVLDQPIGLANASGRFDVRHILNQTPDGGLVMFGYVSEQSFVQVMAGEAHDLVEAAGQATADAIDQLETPPRGALVFSCAARVAPLGPRTQAEAEAISAAIDGVPFAGFFTYGEFARVTGSTGFHNATVVILAL
jgi:hypothetical protein